MKLDELINSTKFFVEQLEYELTAAGLIAGCTSLMIDHICVRLSEAGDVEKLHQEIIETGYGQNISTAIVSGRKIHILKLHHPIQIGPWSTYCIELPYPKPGHLYGDGWEHVEFVLPSAPTVQGIADAFTSMFPGCSEPYEVKVPSVDSDQLPNPSVDLVLDGVGVKFHPYSIEEVVGHTKPSR